MFKPAVFQDESKGKNPAGDLIGAKHAYQVGNTSMHAKSVGEIIKSGNAAAPQAQLIQQSQLSPRPSPVRADILQDLLTEAGYNKSKTEFLFNGFHQGFRLKCASPPSSFTSSNLKSALQLLDIISEKIQKELAASRIAGPFVDPPFENFVCSPLGLCSKNRRVIFV